MAIIKSADSSRLVSASAIIFESAYAYAAKIPILGLYTDSRRLGAANQQKLGALQQVAENQFHYLNLYTAGLIKLNGAILTDEDSLIASIKSRA